MRDRKKVKRCDLRGFHVIEGAIARNQMCSAHSIYSNRKSKLVTYLPRMRSSNLEIRIAGSSGYLISFLTKMPLTYLQSHKGSHLVTLNSENDDSDGVQKVKSTCLSRDHSIPSFALDHFFLKLLQQRIFSLEVPGSRG